jgi:hypothetical protein
MEFTVGNPPANANSFNEHQYYLRTNLDYTMKRNNANNNEDFDFPNPENKIPTNIYAKIKTILNTKINWNDLLANVNENGEVTSAYSDNGANH